MTFNKFVDQCVEGSIAAGVADFPALICALPGIYPSAALQSIRRLIKRKPGYASLLRKFVRQAIQSLCIEMPSRRNRLPVPHPLDFDWRFSESGADRLLRICDRLVNKDKSILLLGAPTVLMSAKQSSTKLKFTLIDSNPAVVRTLQRQCGFARTILCNILRFEPRIRIVPSLVVADPPWYTEHTLSFLWTACRLCANGGHVLICMPPIGTRPGITQERRQILKWASSNGLYLQNIDPSSIPYTTPLFERNALSAEGIRCIPPEWRSGDLFIFKKRNSGTYPRPVCPNEEVWIESQISSVRIRFRSKESKEYADPRLITLVSGDVLPSVSRRDPRRKNVDVWTSGNRVFGCQGPGILRIILEALDNEESPEVAISRKLRRILSASEIRAVAIAASQVREIVRLENDEHCCEHILPQERFGTAV